MAGTARADITPPVGIAHGNWGAATHERAEGVDLPLWATVLVLASGTTRTAIVDIDALFVPRDRCPEFREAISARTSIPPEHIRLSASHTHSGPTWSTSTWVSQGVEMVEPYVTMVKHKIVGAVWEATRRLEPVTLGAERGECRVNINRRMRLPDGRIVVGQNPDGFVDPEVIVVRIDREDGACLATLVNYAAHPTIMAHRNRMITPDYPGPLRRVVESSLGGHCLFLQGATGDLASIEDLTSDRESYHRIGHIIGHEAAKVAWSIRTRAGEKRFAGVVESGAPLGLFAWSKPEVQKAGLVVFERPVTVPTKQTRPVAELESEFAAQKERIQRLREEGAGDEAIQDASFVARRLGIQVELARRVEGRSELAIPVQVIATPNVAFLAAPVEIFSKTGRTLKQESPFATTLVSGYSNGTMGYLPTAEAHAEGGYEVEASPFGVEAADRFVDASLALLREAFSILNPE